MKIKNLLVVCVVLMAVIAMVSCGQKDTPKSLAQETFDLTMQLEQDPGNAAEILAKLEVVEGKVAKLSLTKQLSYASELLKLGAGAIGDSLKSLDIEDAIGDINDALNSSEVQGALDALRNVDVQDALNNAQNAADAANDALRSFGF